MKKVAVIGSGPAGCSASIYLAQAGVETTMLTGPTLGGQLIFTESVTNFVGSRYGYIEEITSEPDNVNRTGLDLMQDILAQTKAEGVKIESEEVVRIQPITIDGKQWFSLSYKENVGRLFDSVIIATGATPKMLGKNESDFWGKGISSCAVCDGNFFRGKDVAVIGSGDTACEEALYLAKICNKVYLLNRGETWKANLGLRELVKTNEKIEIRYNTEVDKFVGSDEYGLEYIYLNNQEDKKELKVSGAFIAIGVNPQSDFVKDLGLTDQYGYIVRYKGAQTAIQGIFTAGDVCDNVYRQAIVAAGDGCKAALECIAYLNTLP